MKKALTALAALAAIYGPLSAHAGTITFDGTLSDQTCVVTGSGSTSGNDFGVTMPSLAVGTFPASGVVPGSTIPFSISLTGCSTTSAQKTAAAFFSAGDIDSTTGLLKNNGGTASGVGIQLSDTRTGVLALNAAVRNQNAKYVDISSGSATLNYAADYYVTGTPSPGLVHSQVVYSIDYQ